MDLQHINVKIFVENPEAVNLEAFLEIFNQWIQRHTTPELLVDVADYRHVYAGPGVVLVGHEANYSMDNTDDRLGLLYNRKARVEGTHHARLAQALHAALVACHRLEEENGLRFKGQEIQIILNDRLLAPNTPETIQALEPELKTFFGKLYAGAPFSIEYTQKDPRERLTVQILSPIRVDVETLLKNLERETVYA